MDAPVEKLPCAWQPLTWRGVAAFAPASLGRLLLLQFLVAALAAGTSIWFLQTACFSVVNEALRSLPAQGEVRSGVLDWRGRSPLRLADNHFLALVIDLNHTGAIRSPAHFQAEFGQNDVTIISLAGNLRLAYPRNSVVAFNRGGLEPWWGAWRPALLVLVAVLVTGGLLLTWALLATFYCIPAWLAGFLAHRDLNLSGSWRLAGAALMPGALLLTGGLLVYGLGALDLIQLTVVCAAHLVIGWAYLLAGALALPRRPTGAALPPNPFAAPDNPPG